MKLIKKQTTVDLYQRKLAIGSKILSQRLCLCFQVLNKNKLLTLAREKEFFFLQLSPYYINSNVLFRISQCTNAKFIAAAAKGPFLLLNLPNNHTLDDVFLFIKKFNTSLIFFGVLYSNVFYTPTRLSLSKLPKSQVISTLYNPCLLLLVLLNQHVKILKLN